MSLFHAPYPEYYALLCWFLGCLYVLLTVNLGDDVVKVDAHTVTHVPKKLSCVVVATVAFMAYIVDCYYRGDFEATLEEKTHVWQSGIEQARAQVFIFGTPLLCSLLLILHSWLIPAKFYGVPEKGALDETGRVRPLMCLIVCLPLQLYTLGLGLDNGANSLDAYIYIPAIIAVWAAIAFLKFAIAPANQTYVNCALFVILAIPVGYFASKLVNGGDFNFLLHGPGDTK